MIADCRILFSKLLLFWQGETSNDFIITVPSFGRIENIAVIVTYVLRE